MRKAFVGISRAVFNAAYRLRSRGARADQVVLLSRQADEPSYDFCEIARAFEQRGWTATLHLQKVTKRNLLRYVGHVWREIGLLAQCKAVVLDRYDPVISLIDFECEGLADAPAEDGDQASAPALHREFPTQPVVLQLWHAFGAFKMFGYQSIGTREGHSREVTDVFNIHRNYSWVACSGEGARAAFAEAFSYPLERVVAIERPEYDELVAHRDMLDATPRQPDGPFRVLMAPTLRKSKASAHPFRELYAARAGFEASVDASVTWAFHPLEADLPAPGNVNEALVACDMVVTDYSSTVYEAYLLGKQVLFYIPDVECYAKSPGLNVNPAKICPQLCATEPDELSQMIDRYAGDPASYPVEQLEAFAAPAFAHAPADGADRVAGTATDRAAGTAMDSVADTATGTAAGTAPTAAERIADFIIAHTR